MKTTKSSKKQQLPEPEIQIDVVEPPPPEEKQLKLTKEEMLEFRALEAEMEVASLKAQLLVLQKKAYLKQIDPLDNLGKFSDQIKTASEQASQTSSLRKKLREAVEKRLGIDLEKYAFDDISGELRAVDL